MGRIKARFDDLKENRPALIAYATAGFPDLPVSTEIMKALLDNCDMLEIGIPFSDPVMDGPIIQRASNISLDAGFRVEDVFGQVLALRDYSDKPLMIMSYYNPVLRMGIDVFAKKASEGGIDGVIIPDLSLEEYEEARTSLRGANLDTIMFVSPTTSSDRMKGIVSEASGFIYCISRRGTTGLRDSLDCGFSGIVDRVREISDIPVAIGIGISTPAQCAEAGKGADGVIVGSAFMQAAADALESGNNPSEAVFDLAGRMLDAVK